MVKSHRIEFVARVARDLVEAVGLALSRVIMVGFSFGAHIAAQACRYCAKRISETKILLVSLLLGMKLNGTNLDISF